MIWRLGVLTLSLGILLSAGAEAEERGVPFAGEAAWAAWAVFIAVMRRREQASFGDLCMRFGIGWHLWRHEDEALAWALAWKEGRAA